MKHLFSTALILALLLLGAALASEYTFEYVYNDYYVYDPGTDTIVYAHLLNSSGLSGTITAELRDSDGTVIGSREFDKYNTQRPFRFNIPDDWTGTHLLAVYVNDEKCSEDFPILIKQRVRAITAIETTEQKIAVSIDCGSGGTHGAQEWLALLEKYNARATFFLTGTWAEQHPEAVEAIVAAGHEIGNHSYAHKHPEKIESWDELYYEIKHSEEIIESLTGKKPELYRVPYGSWTYSLNTVLADLGYPIACQWTVDSHDWDEDNAQGFNASMILSYAMSSRLGAGSIVLFHVGNPSIGSMYKAFDYYTKDLGLEICAIGDLLPDGDYTIDDVGILHPAELD